MASNNEVNNKILSKEDEPTSYLNARRFSPSSLSDLSVESGSSSISSNEPFKSTNKLESYETQLTTVVEELKKRFTIADTSNLPDRNDYYYGYSSQKNQQNFDTMEIDYSLIINSLNFCGNQDDAQLELSTVISIIDQCGKICEFVDSSEYSMTIEVFDHAYTSVLNLIKLFKYHCELPVDSPNFCFKNFGYLFKLYHLKIFKSLLQLVFISTQFNYHKQERLKNCFCLLVVLSFADKNLFEIMFSEVKTAAVYDLLIYDFQNSYYERETSKTPGILSLFVKFQMSLDLENSTLVSEKPNDFLLEALFSNSKSYIFRNVIKHLIYLDQVFNQILNNRSVDQELMNLVTFHAQNKKNQELVAFYCITHDHVVQQLNSIIQKSEKSEILKSVSCKYLLLSISETLTSSFPMSFLSNKQEIKDIYYQNINQNYQAILGFEVSNPSFEGDVSDATFSVIFEIIDQKMRIDLMKEKNLLSYLKASLFTINKAINNSNNTHDSMLKLHLILQEIGSTLSLHSVFETLQFILSSHTLSAKQYSKDHSSLVRKLNEKFGFSTTPPIGRANFAYEDKIQFDINGLNTSDNDYAIYLFDEIASTHGDTCDLLLYDCILLCCSIRSKIYVELQAVNEFNHIMNFSSVENLNPKRNVEQPITTRSSLLYEFRLKNFSSIPIFELGNALDFRIVNESVELSLISNLSILIFGDNCFKSTKNLLKIDIIHHYVIDSLTNFVLIYKEFGLFCIFKFFKYIISQDLKLITLCSQLLSILLKTPTLTNIIENTNTMSALVRQFIDSYDDGESVDFKEISKFLKKNPSPIKPSKIVKGKITLDYAKYLDILTN